jgi:putative lipoic acid-binding regulatory protein
VETFERLREQLELLEWPNVYFFKFIVPSESEKIARITGLFDDRSELSLHPSKTGKYTSVSVKVVMMDVDSIISVYLEASKINGVISL